MANNQVAAQLSEFQTQQNDALDQTALVAQEQTAIAESNNATSLQQSALADQTTSILGSLASLTQITLGQQQTGAEVSIANIEGQTSVAMTRANDNVAIVQSNNAANVAMTQSENAAISSGIGGGLGLLGAIFA